MASSYPYTWTPISDQEKDERKQMYEEQSGCSMIDLVKCDQMDVLMPQAFADGNMGQRIWDMKPKPDDIWIVTYPKCGTTMTQELVWQIINLSKGGQLDSEKAKEFLFLRVPFVEMSCLIRKEKDPRAAPPPEAPEMAQRYVVLME